MRRLLAAASLLIAAGCRTAQPGAAFPPLRAATAQQARAELQERAAAFRGARSLMQVRLTTPERQQSFRAQLSLPDRSRMELTIYTPIGTTAAVVRSAGERLEIDGAGVDVAGSAENLASQFGLNAGGLQPSEMAMLLIGLPPRPDIVYETTAAGIASATVGDVSVTFDTPSFPARRVIVKTGPNRLEVEHVEVVAPQ